jgi:hypothetical protein
MIFYYSLTRAVKGLFEQLGVHEVSRETGTGTCEVTTCMSEIDSIAHNLSA